MYVCLCVGIFEYECRSLWNPEDGTRCPGAGVIDDCELYDMGAGNQTLDLLQKQYVFLTTEISFQPLIYNF